MCTVAFVSLAIGALVVLWLAWMDRESILPGIREQGASLFIAHALLVAATIVVFWWVLVLFFGVKQLLTGYWD
jgi:hypothetical protein